MPKISLDQINAEADARFGPFIIEDVPGGDVVLRNVMRISKDARAKIRVLAQTIEGLNPESADDEAKGLASLRDFFAIIAEGDGGKRLCKEVGDDAGRLMVLMEMYTEATQMGEALRSAS